MHTNLNPKDSHVYSQIMSVFAFDPEGVVPYFTDDLG